MIDQLIEIMKINQWANSLFRKGLEDKFDDLRNLETPYGSFEEITFHISGAVYSWFSRLGIFDFKIKYYQESLSTQEFFSQWEFIDQKLINYLTSLDASDSNKKLSYITSKGKKFEIALKDIILQLNNHSYYHRGHIAYFSRLNEIILPSTDALVYYRTMRR